MKVLFIHGSQDYANAISETLSEHGYQMTITKHNDALRLCKENYYDVIIVSAELPDDSYVQDLSKYQCYSDIKKMLRRKQRIIRLGVLYSDEENFVQSPASAIEFHYKIQDW